MDLLTRQDRTAHDPTRFPEESVFFLKVRWSVVSLPKANAIADHLYGQRGRGKAFRQADLWGTANPQTFRALRFRKVRKN